MGEDGEGDRLLGFGGEAVVIGRLHAGAGEQAAEMVHDLRVIGTAAGGDQLIGIGVLDRLKNRDGGEQRYGGDEVV